MSESELKIKKEQDELLKEKNYQLGKKILKPIICENYGLIIAATITACISGLVWPAYGYLLADSIFTLSINPLIATDREKYLNDAGLLAGLFVLVAAFCPDGIIKFKFLNIDV